MEMIASPDVVFDRLFRVLLGVKAFNPVARVGVISEDFLVLDLDGVNALVLVLVLVRLVALLGGIDLGGRRGGNRGNVGRKVGAE